MKISNKATYEGFSDISGHADFPDCIQIASRGGTKNNGPASLSGLYSRQRGRPIRLLVEPLDSFHRLPSTRRCHVLDG